MFSYLENPPIRIFVKFEQKTSNSIQKGRYFKFSNFDCIIVISDLENLRKDFFIAS